MSSSRVISDQQLASELNVETVKCHKPAHSDNPNKRKSVIEDSDKVDDSKRKRQSEGSVAKIPIMSEAEAIRKIFSKQDAEMHEAPLDINIVGQNDQKERNEGQSSQSSQLKSTEASINIANETSWFDTTAPHQVTKPGPSSKGIKDIHVGEESQHAQLVLNDPSLYYKYMQG